MNIKTSTLAEITQKVAAARKAQAAWGATDVQKRAEDLRSLLDLFVANKTKLGELTTEAMGMPVSVRDVLDIDAGLDYFRWYLEHGPKYLEPEVIVNDKTGKHVVYYEPTGVAAVLVPWNFPFCNFIWGVIPNLLVGNSVVFKHSGVCSKAALYYEELTKSSSLPDGILEFLYGEGKNAGEQLMNQEVDLISFTGSTDVGLHVAEVASKRLCKVLLELGGSAPGVVFADADLSTTIESIYLNRFGNSGQACDGLKRLIVEQSVVDEVITKLKTLLEKKHTGDPSDPATDLGPLVSEKQLQRVEEQVADAIKKGARVMTGGKRPDKISLPCYLPTILTNVTTAMRVWHEEVFGPVLPVITFASEEEAIRLANDTKYGLGSYVFTKDEDRAQRVARSIQSGMVSINGTSCLYPWNPFGGVKHSGLGREHGKYGLHELCQIKVVTSPSTP